MIKNIVRFAKVTGEADNGGQFPIQQVSYKGVVSESLTVFHYGTYANLPNDALGVMFSIDGDESNKAMIGYTPKQRPTDLAQGEIQHYHPITGSSVTFRNSGDVEVVVTGDYDVSVSGGQSVSIDGDQNITVLGSATINVSGAMTANVTGNAEINAANVGVTAESVEVTATSVNIDASTTNLGVGGQPIARLGDAVEVTGVAAGGVVRTGTITSGGSNTSI